MTQTPRPGNPGDHSEDWAAARAGDPVAQSVARIEARLARIESDSGDVTHTIMGELAGLRADLLHAHERLDGVPDTLVAGVRAEIALAARRRAAQRRLHVLLWLVCALCVALAVILIWLPPPDARPLLR